MTSKLILAGAAAFLSLSASAYAQDTVIIQQTDPVMTESTVVVPGGVRTYVLEQQVPSVTYEGDVLEGRVIPDNSLVVGVGKIVRELTQEEIEGLHENSHHYVERGRQYKQDLKRIR